MSKMEPCNWKFSTQRGGKVNIVRKEDLVREEKKFASMDDSESFSYSRKPTSPCHEDTKGTFLCLYSPVCPLLTHVG